MPLYTNQFGHPIGQPIENWSPPPAPQRDPIIGRFCTVEPLNPDRHARDLYEANSIDADGRNWTYLSYGPFDTFAQYQSWMLATCLGNDPIFHTIVDRGTDKAVGLAALMRIDPSNGVIEVGNVCYSPLLQRSPAATEAMYLLMHRVFELGYRRYEWKCDSLNAPSRAAAERLGFTFEGVFRQATVYKGRNRDTAWYSILDTEWPARRTVFEQWLRAENFDSGGRQKNRLSDFLTAPTEI